MGVPPTATRRPGGRRQSPASVDQSFGLGRDRRRRRRDLGSTFRHDLEDADRAAIALVDLAQERHAGLLRVMVPRVDWLEEALERHRFQVAHPNLIYEKPL